MQKIILASQSPRRIQLLQQHNIVFETCPADVEEAHDEKLSPWELTCFNARLKAQTVSASHPEAVVIGADTLVYLDSVPIGKPLDMGDAEQIIARLQGRTHQVCTGVALCRQTPPLNEIFYEITHVTFKRLSITEIQSYLSKIDPLDKAGAYAAQDHGQEIILRVEGSYDNVVGLPIQSLLPRLESLAG